MGRKKVALVLSGGASLGYAHIGVLKVLQKYNIPIDIVVGTSMGALVGAAYCAGIDLHEMELYARRFRLIHFIDLNFDRSGLFSGKGIMKKLQKYLPNVNIESLDKSFACVAADLVTEKQVVMRTGNLRDAVRASMSIPGVFVPCCRDGMVLVDGGIINNLPEDVAVEMGAEVIISSDVLSKCRVHDSPKDLLETFLFSINLSTKEIQKVKAQHSDILLQPNTDECIQIDFSLKTTKKIIKEGELEAEKHIEEIIKLLKE